MTDPIRDGEPQGGYYKCRRVAKGPWLPVIVWWHKGERDDTGALLEDEGWRCEIDGEQVNPYQRWVSFAKHPISHKEFKRLSRLRDWADNHAPDDPYAAPDRPVDLNDAAPLF